MNVTMATVYAYNQPQILPDRRKMSYLPPITVSNKSKMNNNSNSTSKLNVMA